VHNNGTVNKLANNEVFSIFILKFSGCSTAQKTLRDACKLTADISLRHLPVGCKVIDYLRQHRRQVLFNLRLRQSRCLRNFGNPIGSNCSVQLIG
jgi:hypothetical protein